eukprot:gb/GECG01006098.1/.p1 GENE.gb/GECG01006098.1/~~gb/GECG01006098.1/.p1  ORF type:complete len:430 (+),score=18.58 gb/GECG01006098.1/:1-1290(+)
MIVQGSTMSNRNLFEFLKRPCSKQKRRFTAITVAVFSMLTLSRAIFESSYEHGPTITTNRFRFSPESNPFLQQIEDDFSRWHGWKFRVQDVLQMGRVDHCELVLIRKGQIQITRTIPERFVGEPRKRLRLIGLLRKVLRLHPLNVPEVMFAVNLYSFPCDHVESPASAPVFSMARSEKYRDVLYPNPYFVHFFQWREEMLRYSVPWDRRYPVALWRGSCMGSEGSNPRVEMVTLANHSRGLVDAAFTSRCSLSSWPQEHRKSIGSLPVKSAVSFSYMANFKYLIVMPGAQAASYSKALQYLSTLGAVVMLWENDIFEFYYHRLIPGHHFLKVSRSNIIQTVQLLRANDSYAKFLAGNMREWVEQNLDTNRVVTYFRDVFSAYYSLQQFEVPKSIPSNDTIDVYDVSAERDCKKYKRKSKRRKCLRRLFR